MIYIILNNINSIERSGSIIIIDDSSSGLIFLQFIDEYNAIQSQSLFNYILENPSINIDDISPIEDTIDPIVYFYEHVGNTTSGDYISFNGATGGSYSTSYGFTFSTSISLSAFGTSSGTLIDKPSLNNLLIDYIYDNRDGLMSFMDSNLIITGTSGIITSITDIGSYSLSFDFADIAENYLDGVIINLDITS